ncbi:hypothetical protein RJ641_011897 [Dillenia turbinata]|uniref:Uncharacterized protein n=1 Tax=Dillenia turbinata TaxID=194707 RepID=A0AAN8V9B8_9MAGN
MEWPSPKKEGYSTRCVPFVRIANIPRTTGRRATKNWQTGPGAGARSEKSSLDQPSAPTNGHSKTWRMMAHPTQERLCHMGTHDFFVAKCYGLNAELLTLLVRMGVHPKVFLDCMHTSVSNLVQHGKFH